MDAFSRFLISQIVIYKQYKIKPNLSSQKRLSDNAKTIVHVYVISKALFNHLRERLM